MDAEKRVHTVALMIAFFTSVCTGLVESDSGCASNPCPFNTFCSNIGALICKPCHASCYGCTGSGSAMCDACQTGYERISGSCRVCRPGYYGKDCKGVCQCPDHGVCDPVLGICQKSCKRGFYDPPECLTACPDGKYGINCLYDCHCDNDSVCDKEYGFCPNGLCQKDWAGSSCNKRLPQLSNPPEVVSLSCKYMTVRWSAWSAEKDIGDMEAGKYSSTRQSMIVKEDRHWGNIPPTSNNLSLIGIDFLQTCMYLLDSGMCDDPSQESSGPLCRVYSALFTPSGVMEWVLVAELLHDPSVTSYSVNLGDLIPDAYYRFRVDVHYIIDSQIVESASLGLTSDLTLVPCNTPGPVEITSLLPTTSSLEINIKPPSLSNGTVAQYYILYSKSGTFTLSEALVLKSPALDTEPLVIRGLQSNTVYYVKLRASAGVGYGPYGDVMHIRTLKETLPSSDIQLKTCIGVTWESVQQREIPVTGYTVRVKAHADIAGDGVAENLPANVTQYFRCGLAAGSAYVISVSSQPREITSSPVEVVFYVEQSDLSLP